MQGCTDQTSTEAFQSYLPWLRNVCRNFLHVGNCFSLTGCACCAKMPASSSEIFTKAGSCRNKLNRTTSNFTTEMKTACGVITQFFFYWMDQCYKFSHQLLFFCACRAFFIQVLFSGNCFILKLTVSSRLQISDDSFSRLEVFKNDCIFSYSFWLHSGTRDVVDQGLGFPRLFMNPTWGTRLEFITVLVVQKELSWT